MKKVMAIIFLIGAIGLQEAKAQEKTMPKDSTPQRNRTRTETHDTPIPIMDIPLTEKDNTRIDNMHIKQDSTLMEMYQKRLPTKVDSTAKRVDNGKYFWETPKDTALNGMYNGQRIRSDTIRNSAFYDGMQHEDIPNLHKKPENRGVLLQNGQAMIVKKGKMTVIKAYTNLSFGTKVMSNGTIVKQDGTKTKLQEGEFVNMKGEIVPMKQP